MFITASWCNSVHQNLAEDYKNGGIGTGRKVVAPSLSSLVTSFRFNFIIFIIMILWMWWREQDLNGKVSQKKMLNWWMMMKWCFYYEVSHFLRNFSFPRSTFDPSSLLWIKRWSEWNPKVSHYFCNLNGNMSERMREWQELHSFSFLLASRNGKEREEGKNGKENQSRCSGSVSNKSNFWNDSDFWWDWSKSRPNFSHWLSQRISFNDMNFNSIFKWTTFFQVLITDFEIEEFFPSSSLHKGKKEIRDIGSKTRSISVEAYISKLIDTVTKSERDLVLRVRSVKNGRKRERE